MNRRQRRAHQRKTGEVVTPRSRPLNLGIKDFKRKHSKSELRQMYKDEINGRVKAIRDAQLAQDAPKKSKGIKRPPKAQNKP